MRRAQFVLPILTALYALSMAACTPLQTLAEGACGNGVVDANEDCEPFSGSEFACRPPGDAMECTIVCHDDGTCPTGYGCGVGDVCRKPGGSFESTPFVQAGSKADMLLAGDFDADRRQDVVAVEPGRARIYFADASGNLDQTTVTSVLPPAVGKLGPLAAGKAEGPFDATDDLVLPLNLGIGALLSEGNRSFKSKAYGSITLDTIALDIPGYGNVTFDVTNAVPVPVDAVPAAVGERSGDETAVLMELTAHLRNGTTADVTVFAPFASGGDAALFALADTRIDQLSGPPVTGNLDADACEEIAFPQTGATHLSVYKLCRPVGAVGFDWADFKKEEDAILADVALGGEISGPAFAVDVDGDGRLDLAVPVAAGSGLELRVAYGTGTGAFHSTSPVPAGEVPDNQAAPYAALMGTPLALADLDGGGGIDVVDTGGVARGERTTAPDGHIEGTFLAWYPAQRPWTDAAVTDINGDGLPDVLASSDGATDIDVLLGHPSGFWNPSQISTDGTVSQLIAGDFDGDLVGDVVYDDILSPTESLLLISYGRTSGGPEDASEVATFESVERLVAGDVRSFGADSITDLGAMTARAEADAEGGAKERAVSFFPGTATRLLQAPLVLGESGQTADVPLSTALGLVDAPPQGAPDHRDVLVLAVDPEPDVKVDAQDPLALYKLLAATLHVWTLYGGDGEAAFDTERASRCAMPQCFFFPRLESAHSIAMGPSADGRPMMVAATPFMTFTGTGAGEVQISSLLARIALDDPAQCWAEPPGSEEVIESGPGELFYRVRLADLDTNKIPEILAIKRTYDPDELKSYLAAAVTGDQPMNNTGGGPAGPSKLTVQRSELLVVWDGDFSKTYALPEGSEDVRDFTVGEIDGDGNPDLLVLDGARLRRFRTANGSQELIAAEDVADVPIPATGAQAVLLADVDGDGIQDVALRGESLQVFRGLGVR